MQGTASAIETFVPQWIRYLAGWQVGRMSLLIMSEVKSSDDEEEEDDDTADDGGGVATEAAGFRCLSNSKPLYSA